ncbi:MAG: hypothetical protein M1292_08330 [Bacteroidetes bacterium]|nr:hypothetical protein [Bacteroidota bacterium]
MTGVVIVSLFLLLKHALTPDSFGQYGHYRGKALNEIAALPIHYVGSKSCVSCHDTIVTMKSEGYHSDLACEGCHGAAYKHIENPKTEKLIKPDSREFCGKCHSINKARPEKAITQQNIQGHNPGKKCVICHNPHQP